MTRVIPEPTNDNGKATYKKNEAKAKRILFDSVNDRLIPHIFQLKIAKEVYDALTSLFETKNSSWKRALRNKLRNINMTKTDAIATYFMKISQLKEQLIAIGEKVDDEDLVAAALDGLSLSWETYVLVLVLGKIRHHLTGYGLIVFKRKEEL